MILYVKRFDPDKMLYFGSLVLGFSLGLIIKAVYFIWKKSKPFLEISEVGLRIFQGMFLSKNKFVMWDEIKYMALSEERKKLGDKYRKVKILAKSGDEIDISLCPVEKPIEIEIITKLREKIPRRRDARV